MSVGDLSIPLRTAILGTSEITALLPTFMNSKTVFTRRPVPDNATYPMIVISPNISVRDEGGIDNEQPMIVRDIAAYGLNDESSNYRDVETLADLIHTLFHNQRNAITIAGWHVVRIVATGPMPAPADDEKHVGRVVSLQIRLARLN